MKCRVCRQPAVIDLRRHNSNFCRDHMLRFCRDQVAKAIAEHDMLAADDRVLVAVSGGKDSLALWDILVELGYKVDGLTLGLGIGDYSEASTSASVAFAEQRGPMAAGNRHLRYKEALNTIEAASPGTKHAFYFVFLERAAERFLPEVSEARDGLGACASCGAPTPDELCAFCRLVDWVSGHELVPVELLRGSR